jgi:signal transduction histidine kinase
MGLRQRVQEAVAILTDNCDIDTTLRMTGPLGVVHGDVVEHATLVVTEAVSNAVRHSGAQHLSVEIGVADELTVVVTDDGCGVDPDNARRSGLTNMQRRAELLGGGCHVEDAPHGGTRVHWFVPLDRP